MHPFTAGPFPGTTRVSRYQKGKTNLNFTEARDIEWQWHQLYASLHLASDRQPRHHLTTQFFRGRMSSLTPNQQRQSTEDHDNVYGAMVMTIVTARLRPVPLVNAD